MEELNDEEMMGVEGGACFSCAKANEIKQSGKRYGDALMVDVGASVVEIKIKRVLTARRDTFAIESSPYISKGKTNTILADGGQPILKIRYIGREIRINRTTTARGKTPAVIEFDYTWATKIAGSTNMGYKSGKNTAIIRW